MTRRHWNDLPKSVRAVVEAHTGPVQAVNDVAAGSVCEMAAILHTATGPLFVKGIRAENPLVWMQRNEARINPWLPEIAPRLRWTVEQDGWLLLGFTHVAGHHADASPGSLGLPAVAETLTVLSQTPCPPIPVQPATRRWAGRIDPALVDGGTLVHSDMSLKNFLVADGRACLVDWAMPCRGAAWLDTAWMVPRLIRAGHSPCDAERWAGQIPAWAQADPGAVTAFAGALAELWEERLGQRPAPHLVELAAAVQGWVEYRAAVMVSV